MGNNAYTYLVLHLGAYLCGAALNYFFLRKYLLFIVGITPGVVPIFGIFEIFGFF